MEAKAVAKTIRIAPRKARLVIDLIRGKKIEEAEMILKSVNHKAVLLIERRFLTNVTNDSIRFSYRNLL